MSTVQKCKEARERIFSALHRYYTDVLSLPAYAGRLAECMALLSGVEVKSLFVKLIFSSQILLSTLVLY